MFATFHVLGSMLRVWKRKRTSFFRNLLFMIQYVYMIILTVLSFILVGSFYAAFSIFVRATFTSSDCLDIFKPANFLENVYLFFLAACLFLSITLDMNHAETGFRYTSMGMGLFIGVMIYSTVVYTLETIENIGPVILLAIWVLTYLLPLFTNFTTLRLMDYIKGIFFTMYLSPTYVNLFTIFAISNIHDLSWGNRPSGGAGKSAQQIKTEKMYKNYRANFLIFFLVVNITVATVITNLNRSGEQSVIEYIAYALAGILVAKLVLALIHRIVTFFHVFMVNRHKVKKRRNNKVYKEVREFNKDLTARIKRDSRFIQLII